MKHFSLLTALTDNFSLLAWYLLVWSEPIWVQLSHWVSFIDCISSVKLGFFVFNTYFYLSWSLRSLQFFPPGLNIAIKVRAYLSVAPSQGKLHWLYLSRKTIVFVFNTYFYLSWSLWSFKGLAHLYSGMPHCEIFFLAHCHYRQFLPPSLDYISPGKLYFLRITHIFIWVRHCEASRD